MMAFPVTKGNDDILRLLLIAGLKTELWAMCGAHTLTPSPQMAGTGGSLGVPGQPDDHRETQAS